MDRGDEASVAEGERISRRRFLRRTIAGAALLAAGGTLARNVTGYHLDEEDARSLQLLSPKEAIVLSAIFSRMLAPAPEAATVPDLPDPFSCVRFADGYLARLPPHLSSDVRALIQLVEHSPFLFSLSPSRFTRLSPTHQDAILDGWATSRLTVRRQGFVALKSLAMMAFYGDPRTFAIPGFPGPMLPTGG